MKCGVTLKVAAIVEVWIDKRSEMGFEFRFVDAEYKYRAAVRIPDGSILWKWARTKKEAEDYIRPWLTKKG